MKSVKWLMIFFAALSLTLADGCTRKPAVCPPGQECKMTNDDPPIHVHDGSLKFQTNDESYAPVSGTYTVPTTDFQPNSITGFQGISEKTFPAVWTEIDVCDTYDSVNACHNGIIIKRSVFGAKKYFQVTLTDPGMAVINTPMASSKHTKIEHNIGSNF